MDKRQNRPFLLLSLDNPVHVENDWRARALRPVVNPAGQGQRWRLQYLIS